MNYIDQFGVEYSEDRKTLIKAPKDLSGEYYIKSGVTTIAKSAFEGCGRLTSIHIPASFQKLETSAFSKCIVLGSIYYNGDLIDWLQLDWNSCFDAGYNLYFNNELVSDITIPDAISLIKDNAFYWCLSLKHVNFHAGVAEIGVNAFNKSGITGLLTLPEGIKKLDKLSFYCCSNLTGIKLPASLSEVWFGSFSCCYNLKHITVSPLNPKYKTGIGILYNNEGTLIAVAPCASDEPLKLPDSIHKIAKDTFCYSAVPKGGVILSKNITEVVNEAFLKVTGLDVYIPVGSTPYFKKMGVPMDRVHEMFSIETAFLPGHNNISAIVNNPFRILGVYANASQKEITANARKIKRFIEVGKTVEFETDFNNILPPVVRTEESVDAALATLTNMQEKFKYAMFWFVNTDEQDKKGLEFLLAGDKESAKKVFGEIYDWHSYLNLSTLCFSINEFRRAIEAKTDGIHFINHHKLLAAQICGAEFEIDNDTAAHIFINTLLEDITIPECRALFYEYGHEEDREYLDELLSSKYTRIINDAISTAKNVSKNDSHAALEAGRLLKESTRASLEEFAQYVGENNAEYGMVADRLANQILQCAIDYYNDSIDRFAVFDALELAEYALSIAKGQVKKDRCQQNYDILKRNAAKIPPREVANDDDFLSSFLAKHKSDAGSIENAWYILEQGASSILHIKECLARITDKKSAAYEHLKNYLTMVSTALVNLSLNKLIDAVNNATRYQAGIVSQAWDLMLNMENFPMEMVFKTERFLENKKTLRSMVERTEFFVRSKPNRIIDLRTSEEVWNECRTIKDFENYIQRFPKGNHIQSALSRIEQLKIQEEDNLWEAVKKSGSYSEYINKYPNGRYIEEAVNSQRAVEQKSDDDAFSACETMSQFELYLRNYPDGRHVDVVREKLAVLKAAKAEIERRKSITNFWRSVITAEIVTIMILLAKIFSSPKDFQGVTTIIIVASIIAVAIYLGIKHAIKNK